MKHDLDLDRIKRLDLEVQKIRESATDELGVLQKTWSTDSRLISMYSPGIQKSAGEETTVPPSQVITSPMVKPQARELRKIASPAISSGVPTRPLGFA